MEKGVGSDWNAFVARGCRNGVEWKAKMQWRGDAKQKTAENAALSGGFEISPQRITRSLD